MQHLPSLDKATTPRGPPLASRPRHPPLVLRHSGRALCVRTTVRSPHHHSHRISRRVRLLRRAGSPRGDGGQTWRRCPCTRCLSMPLCVLHVIFGKMPHSLSLFQQCAFFERLGLVQLLGLFNCPSCVLLCRDSEFVPLFKYESFSSACFFQILGCSAGCSLSVFLAPRSLVLASGRSRPLAAHPLRLRLVTSAVPL